MLQNDNSDAMPVRVHVLNFVATLAVSTKVVEIACNRVEGCAARARARATAWQLFNKLSASQHECCEWQQPPRCQCQWRGTALPHAEPTLFSLPATGTRAAVPRAGATPPPGPAVQARQLRQLRQRGMRASRSSAVRGTSSTRESELVTDFREVAAKVDLTIN